MVICFVMRLWIDIDIAEHTAKNLQFAPAVMFPNSAFLRSPKKHNNNNS